MKNFSENIFFDDRSVESNDKLLLNIILIPNRSLTRIMFFTILGILLFISISMGIFFYSIGAWPVIGFFGLDIIIFLIVFFWHNQSLKICEKIILNNKEMIIKKTKPFRKDLIVKFSPPNWINVTLKKSIYNKTRLVIHSHGSAIFVGDFLTKTEKKNLAQSLNNEISKLKK